MGTFFIAIFFSQIRFQTAVAVQRPHFQGGEQCLSAAHGIGQASVREKQRAKSCSALFQPIPVQGIFSHLLIPSSIRN